MSGLEKLHKITENKQCKLRIELQGFDSNSAWAEYGFVWEKCFFVAFSNFVHYTLLCSRYFVILRILWLNTFGAAWIPRGYSTGADGFWVVFTQHLDSKLNNWKSTCLIDLQHSGEMHFYKKNIRAKFVCKRLSMKKVIVFYATTYST